MARVSGMLLLAALVALLASACSDTASARSEVVIRYSQFVPDLIEVPAGEPVAITLRNDDPIEHEWIVGPADVHERHRTGTELFHATRPTEVTVPALSTRVTTITFAEPAELAYICHLPGHEAYGMAGTLRVEVS